MRLPPRFAAIALACLALAAEATYVPKAWDIVTLAEGVHGFVWRDPLADPIEGNALFIVNDEDVVVVDSGLLPSSARIMARELGKLTTKPVRYVVNTHWHNDHVGGNGVYRELWPGVEFVSHEDTRTDILEQVYAPMAANLEANRRTTETYAKSVESGLDGDGKPLAPERRQRLAEVVAMYRAALPDLAEVKREPPAVTFRDRLVLRRGERTIEIRWLGLANTRGDAVVFLPKERIVATGDLLVWPVPFMFGSYYAAWIETLAALDALPADTLFLAHGAPQRDRAYLRQVRELLGEIVAQARKAAASGLPPEEARKRVDLSAWRARFAGGDAKLERAFDAFVAAPAIERAIRQAREEPAAFTQKLRG